MQINTRFRLILAILILAGLAACSRSAAGYMQSAKKYFDSGKYADAVILYKKAIQRDPKNGEAYYRLALANIKLKKIPDAYQAMSEASRYSADNTEIQSVFADFCFELYLLDSKHPKVLYDRVADVSAQLLHKNPKSYDGLRLRGYLEMADRKPDEAIATLRQADQLRPWQSQVVFPLTMALLQNHQQKDAEQLAVAFLQRNKNFGPMYDVLSNVYLADGRTQQAEDLLNEKVQYNPKQAAFVLQLASFYWARKRQDDARKTLQKLIDRPNDFPHAHLLAGDFYLGARDFDAARAEYNQGESSDPKSRLLYQKKLVNLLILQGKRDDARKMLDDLGKSNPDDSEVKLVHATMLIESGKSQDVDAAIALLQPLVEKNANDASPHYRLGQAYKLKGQTQKAETEWRAAVKDDPVFIPARLALAELELQTRHYSNAIAETDQLLARDPQNRNARLLRALALAGSSREEEAREILNQLLAEDPNSEVARLALARLDLLKKDYASAEKRFAELYKPGQSDLRPLDGLLTTYLAQKEPAKAIALLDKELQSAPDSFELLSRHAEVNVQSGSYAQALTEYQRLLTKDPNSPRLNIRVGEVALMARNKDVAVTCLQKAAALDPKDPRPLVTLGALRLAEGDKKGALDIYQKVLALRPDDPYMLNNVAFLMAEVGGDTKQALELARKGLNAQPSDPHLTDTVGYIYLKEKMNDSALQAFRAAVQKDPGSATYRLHLANALLTQGDKYEAKTQLEAALLRNPSRDEETEIKSLLAKVAP